MLTHLTNKIQEGKILKPIVIIYHLCAVRTVIKIKEFFKLFLLCHQGYVVKHSSTVNYALPICRKDHPPYP